VAVMITPIGPLIGKRNECPRALFSISVGLFRRAVGSYA